MKQYLLKKKKKVLIVLVLLSSLFGYLEWGESNSSFLFQIEYEIVSTLFTKTASVIHPLTVIPLLGQILLLIVLFQKKMNKVLIYTGISCLGLLLGLIFFIGILTTNWKILFSTLPFILISLLTIRHAMRQ